jgi:hypothetical protein
MAGTTVELLLPDGNLFLRVPSAFLGELIGEAGELGFRFPEWP